MIGKELEMFRAFVEENAPSTTDAIKAGVERVWQVDLLVGYRGVAEVFDAQGRKWLAEGRRGWSEKKRRHLQVFDEPPRIAWTPLFDWKEAN